MLGGRQAAARETLEEGGVKIRLTGIVSYMMAKDYGALRVIMVCMLVHN